MDKPFTWVSINFSQQSYLVATGIVNTILHLRNLGLARLLLAQGRSPGELCGPCLSHSLCEGFHFLKEHLPLPLMYNSISQTWFAVLSCIKAWWGVRGYVCKSYFSAFKIFHEVIEISRVSCEKSQIKKSFSDDLDYTILLVLQKIKKDCCLLLSQSRI